MKSVTLQATTAALLLATPATSADKPVVMLHELHITEGGGFFAKTIHELSKSEFQGAVNEACSALGGSCGTEAAQARAATSALDQQLTSAGGNYLISGQILEHRNDSDEWRGVFDALPEYEVCAASLNYGEMSITGESTFNVSVRRTPFEFGEKRYQGLSFYAVVPKHRLARHWINATFLIVYVPAGTSEKHNCQADRSTPWLCKGQTCDPLSRW